jgi:hypothetical protein
MRPVGFFVPGRVGRRAELAAQARPYGRFFESGRHDAEVGPMGRDPARHYRRRRGGRGRDTGGAWRSARPELRRPTAQAGTAVTPAPHGASGQGRPEPHPCSGARRQSRGGPRWWRVEAEAGGAWSRSRGGGGRRGGSSGAPRRKPARPDLRPPRCARSGEDSRRFGPAAARWFGERSKGRPWRRDLQGAMRKGGGGGICSASEAGGGGGMGRGDWIGRSRGVRVVSKTRVSDIYM